MKRGVLVGLAVLVAGLAGLPRAELGAQSGGPPQAPTDTSAAITGTVVDGATKSPVAGAVVYLSNEGRAIVGDQSRQFTDDKGRFGFLNLPAGNRYTLTASAFGYLDGAFGRENLQLASQAPIVVRAGEWVSNARVVLWRPAAISGTVVDERGDPIAGVFVRVLGQVRLAGRDQLAAGPLTSTDDRGAYRIAGLTPGRYLVQVPSVQASAPSAPVTATPIAPSGPSAGAPTTQVVMAPGPSGPSIVAANESALDLDPAARLLLRNYPTPPASSGGRRFAYPPTFHPSATTVAGATTITVTFGEERGGIDVALNAVPAWRVAGIVEGPSESLLNRTLRLMPEGLEGLGHGSEAATALVGTDGRFVFLNVPGGAYVIDAPNTVNEIVQSPPSGTGASVSLGPGFGFPIPPSRQMGWSSTTSSVDVAPAGTAMMIRNFLGNAPNFLGRTSLAIGRDEDNVVIRMRPAGTVSGRVAFESTRAGNAQTASSSVSLRLDAADINPALGRPFVGSTVTEFTIGGVLPGRYFLRTASSTWMLKSIVWQGRDYTDVPFDAAATQDIAGVQVNLTDAAPTLTGTVRDAQGAPASAAAVIIFPVDQSLWTNFGTSPTRIKQIASGSDGTYRATTIPAGDYYAVAFDASGGARWFEPEFFAAAARVATRVSLKWGETSTADLAISQIR